MPDTGRSGARGQSAPGDAGTAKRRASELAKDISYFLNGEDDRTARALVIRALDRKDILELYSYFARHLRPGSWTSSIY